MKSILSSERLVEGRSRPPLPLSANIGFFLAQSCHGGGKAPGWTRTAPAMRT
jgi:hypothetical protein